MKRLVVAAVLSAVALTPSTAHAAFPGVNGRLAFARTTDADGATKIVTTDASGGALAELTDNTPAAQPAWSADGKRVAFVARDTSAPHDLEVFIASDAGGSATQITHNTADDLGPAFSPDGKQLVLERLDDDASDGDTSGDLVVLTLETGKERFLTRTRDLDTDPAWSRYGQIAFQRDPVDEDSRLMIMDADGTDPRTLLTGDYSGPDFSPDGGLLAYRGPVGVGVTAVDGGATRALGISGKVGDPVWSPDGTKLAVARDTEFTDGEILVVNAQTGVLEAWVEAKGGVTDRDPAWQPLGKEAVLLHSGPSGLVLGGRARFEFGAADAVGAYECRLDGDSFSPCTSPRLYDGLGDGPHRFEVVLKTATGYGPVTARAWRADTVAPTARITGGPTGVVTTPDAELTFESSEPDGATFRCALDGRDAQDCSSPLKVRGLGPGKHTVTVQAVDRVGWVSEAVTRSWDVAVTEPPVVKAPLTDCAAGSTPELKFGKIVARAVDKARCLRPYKLDGRDVTVTGGPVALNGLLLTPAAGELVVLDKLAGGGSVFTTGRVRLQAGPIDTEFEDKISWTGLAATGTVYLTLFDKTEEQAIKEGRKGFVIAGLPLVALPTFEISSDNGGQTKVGLKLGLPTLVFKKYPGDQENKGIAVEFGMTASNDKGVSYQGKLTIAEAWLMGKFKLTDIEASIDTGGPTGDVIFDGAASLEFGSAPAGWTASKFKVGIQLGPKGFLGPLRKLSLQASSLNRPLGSSGIFLQRAGIEFGKRVENNVEEGFFAGNAGLSLGPEIEIEGFFKGSALSLDGKLTIANPLKPELPWRVEAAGEMKLVEIPVAGATVKYINGRRVELEGKLDFTIAGYGLYSEIGESWVTRDAFNVKATSDVVLPGLVDFRDAQTVVSSKGWATCFGPVGLRVGFGKEWGKDLAPLGRTCDVGAYSVPLPPDPPASGATASRATGVERTFSLRDDLHVIEARGAAGPPKVSLRGPGGFALDTPAGPEGVQRGGVLLVQDPARKATTIVLTRPRAGEYTLVGEAAEVRTAGVLPTPKLRATVSRSGARRVLRWRADALSGGQTVQFVERGATGDRVLGTSGKARGSLRFRPLAGGGTRRIEAVVLRGGLPRSTATVARFSAGSANLRRVSGVKRRGLVVRWRPQAAAIRHVVAYSTASGVSETRTVRGTSLRLPAKLRKQTVSVTVVPLGADDRPGGRTRATLRP